MQDCKFLKITFGFEKELSADAIFTGVVESIL